MAIALLWSRDTNVFTVSVVDGPGAGFELVLAPNERPLDVFQHPYAYAALRGVVVPAPQAPAAPAPASAIRAEVARGMGEMRSYLAARACPRPNVRPAE
jgi:hypothetical protein